MIGYRNLAAPLAVFVLMTVAYSSAAADSPAATTEAVADPSQRFTRARKLRHDGAHHAALQELTALRKEFPLDVDYALARAQILIQLHRDDEALHELSQAAELAPDYEDVWKLRFVVLARQTGARATAEYEAVQKEAAERFPDAIWWQSSGHHENAAWTLLAGVAHETLSNGQPDWNNQFIELQLEKNSMSRYSARLGRDQRFAGTDVTVGLGTEHSWSQGWFAGLDLVTAGNSTFQPEFSYSGHLGRVVADGWVAKLQYRQRHYPSANVDSTVATLEKYVGDFRVAYSLGLSRLQGAANLPNHTLTANWFYAEHSSVGMTVNSGKEAESIGNGTVLETDVRGISFSGRRPLGERFGIQWWVGVHDQGDFYRRQFLGLAVSYRL